MNAASAIQRAVEHAGHSSPIKVMRELSGGCIHRAHAIELMNGEKLAAKINRASMLGQFEEERQSLEALFKTKTVIVPRALTAIAHDGAAVLLMTFIEPPISPVNQSHWQRFGTELAALHNATAPARYGFDIDNHIGSTPQPNGWHDDWVEFNAVNRLGFQLRTARNNRLLDPAQVQQIEQVIGHLDRFIPRRPKPSLLHGDLWSGNALSSMPGTFALIDPACSIGDGWADIAMTKLFGGFPPACLDAYGSLIEDHDQLEQRIAIYQLYHVLNHLNIFGRGYVGQAMEIAKKLMR